NAAGRVATLSAFASHVSLSVTNARLYEEVEEALRQQVDLNRQKGDFVAAVSHELRTPLTSVLGAVSTVLRLDNRLDEERRKRLLEMASDQGQRLKRLIEDILVVAAAEQTTVTCEREPVDVHRLLADVTHELEVQAGERLSAAAEPGATGLVSDTH